MTTYYDPGMAYDCFEALDDGWEYDYSRILSRLKEQNQPPPPTNRTPIKVEINLNLPSSDSLSNEKERPPAEPTSGVTRKAQDSGSESETTSQSPPKKIRKMTKKNAFFVFMEERRPQLEADGKKFPGGWKDVADTVSEEWKGLDPEEKERFNEKAKEFNERIGKNGGNHSSDTPKPQPGKSPAVLAREKISAELQEIKIRNREIVYKLFENETWKTKAVVVCFLSLYLGDEGENICLPAEIGLTAFTLKDGIISNFGRLIVPARNQIPDPWSTEILSKGKKFGLPPVGSVDATEFSDLDSLMESMASFLFGHRSQCPVKNRNELVLFALDSDFERVHNALNWLNQVTGETRPIHILSLNLWAHLASTSSGNAKTFRSQLNHPGGMEIRGKFKEEFIGKETLNSIVSPKRQAGEPLNGCFIYNDSLPLIKYGLFVEDHHVDEAVKDIDNYRYYDELCCVYHNRKEEAIHHCALNTTNRYAYGILEILTISNEIEVSPTHHYPEIGKPELEWKRRKEMLFRWGVTDFEKKLLELPSPSELCGSFSSTLSIGVGGGRNRINPDFARGNGYGRGRREQGHSRTNSISLEGREQKRGKIDRRYSRGMPSLYEEQ